MKASGGEQAALLATGLDLASVGLILKQAKLFITSYTSQDPWLQWTTM